MELAVLFDTVGKLASIDNFHEVIIYTKKEQFEIERRCLCTLHDESLEEVRKSISLFMDMLGDSRIIVSRQITGIPFHILDKHQYIMCEAKQFSEQLLEQVYEDYCVIDKDSKHNDEQIVSKQEQENNGDDSKKLTQVKISPYKIDEEGNYMIDMIQVQKDYPQISSKKVLLPFLNNEWFQSLTIVCSHVMPWIERYVNERNLCFTVKREHMRYEVVLTRSYEVEEE